MITAEDSSAVQTIDDKHSSGSLLINVGSFYNEFQIINCSNEPIYAVDYRNNKVLIKQHPTKTHGDERRLEIRSRIVDGQRTRDILGNETSANSHLRIVKIPYELLRDEPVFVHEINAVLCLAHQIAFVKHPHSKEARLEEMAVYRDEVTASLTAVPVHLNANDPTGRISELYVEINGTICAVKVTAIAKEGDFVHLSLRDKPYSLRETTVHKTTFIDLLEQDPHVWTFGGFRLSDNRDWFEQVLGVERAKQPATIEVSAVTAMLKQARECDAARIEDLTDENKELKRQISALKAAHDALRSGDYHERVADLAHKKLHLDERKLDQAETEAKHALAAEKLKLRKELIATIGVVAKTAAIVVPVAFGLFKAVQAMRAKT